MSSPPLIEWDHGLFGELFTLLGRVATQPVNPPIRRLQTRLEDAKPWLLALTNVPGPNEADKAVVDKGKQDLCKGRKMR
jgi:nuclear pore complex protein Nup205